MTLTRHYWITIVSLVAVFAAGSGFALMVAATRKPYPAPPPPELQTVPSSDWVETTLARLDTSLALRPAQLAAIREDIVAAARDVENVRERAILEYHLLLLRIHHDIAPKLDPDQQEQLRTSAESLQLTIENRFPSLDEGTTALQPSP